MPRQRNSCPICKLCSDDVEKSSTGDRYSFNCARCGKYEISGTAHAIVDGRPANTKLSAWIRHQESSPPAPILNSNTIETIPIGIPDYRVGEKQIIFLRELENRTDYAGQKVPIVPEYDFTLAWCKTTEELEYLIRALMGRQLIELHDWQDPRESFILEMSIAPAGWALLDETVMPTGQPHSDWCNWNSGDAMPISNKQLAQIRKKQRDFLDALIEKSQLWTKEISPADALEAGRQVGLEDVLVREFLVYWVNAGEIDESFLKLAEQVREKIQSIDSESPDVGIGPAEKSSQFDVFISHASEDKASVARPLYEALLKRGVSVWFDQAELTIGDSLRRKIDQGLARCRFGVVILSSQFFAKEWPQRELDGLVARETGTGEKAILPIWHNLDRQTVLDYSPPLADKLAANSQDGVEKIAEQIVRALAQ